MKSLPDDIVRAWLRMEDSVMEKCGDPLTWEILVKALQKIRQTGIADDILREKCWENEKGMYMYTTVIITWSKDKLKRALCDVYVVIMKRF